MIYTLIQKILTGKPKDEKVSVRTLIKFLKAFGIRQAFVTNFFAYPISMRYQHLSDLCNDNIAPIDWIRMSFRWGATKEGREFWENISNEWLEYLLQNEKHTEII